MKKIFPFLVFVLLYSTFSYGQYDEKYKEKFLKIRTLLGGGKTGQAFQLLNDLYTLDSANYYTNYLMGVCYTEQNIVTKRSIKHLEYATKNILPEYGYIPYNEKRAPMFSWYYLTKAYSQNGMCVKARLARDKFIDIYGKYKRDYFVENVDKFLISCKDQSWYAKNKEIKDGIVTKKVHYTVRTPLYSIQVGAFSELVPIRNEFDDLKNVEAFMDTKGVLRYVIGRFIHKSQALKLLEIIQTEKGYEDAFVVDVNKEKRYSEEVIIVDNVSFKAHIKGKISFKVQIGAFRDSIPDKLLKIYLKIEGIEEITEGNLTLMAVGNYPTYMAAANYKAELTQLGIKDGFIVAYNNKNKISLQAAIKHVQRQQNEAAEKALLEIENGKKKKKKKK